jgi:DNA-binding CsgD family transcriptional regulator/tetratricopeptide (TPR) repeat protein
MQLLERQASLEMLQQSARDLRAGEGRVVLVSGEAGLGKTSLLESFASTHRGRESVLWGRCDPLFTPSPLAPFHEITAQMGGRLSALPDDQAGSTVVFSKLLQELRRAGPAIYMIEDLHWADEATLDAIKFLGRRIQSIEALLIVSYRDDELDQNHSLRNLLAVLATCRAVRRVPLAPLSVDSVRQLIRKERFDPEIVHRKTGGNPFLVTELLASGEADRVPPTIRDIVLQRAARLPKAARNVLEVAAVIGPRSDARLLRRIVGEDADLTEACMGVGLLHAEGETLVLRHELTRQAVLESIAPPRRAVLHGQVLEALLELGTASASLLTHHAEAAGNAEAVRTHAPVAAKLAKAVGSHREAADQLARALRYTGPNRAEERASLLEALAEECALLDRQGEAADARRQAVNLWRELDNPRKEGSNLAALAWPLVRSGLNAEADACSLRAIAILERLGPSRELAAALRMQAHLRMLNRDKGSAMAWGRKAIAMAEALGDQETLASAHLAVGAAMLVTDDLRGRTYLDRSIALAREHNFDGLVALAYLNIGSSYGEQYRFAEAEPILKEGMAYASERDLDHALHYTQAWLALTYLYQGRWTDAADMAHEVLQAPELAVVSRIMALVALGRVRARRGDPGVWPALDEALALAQRTGTLQRLAPVRAARAEAAWLAGNPEQARTEAEAVWDLALAHRHPWHAGEFAFWRRRAGSEVRPPSWIAQPFLLELNGKWQDAATTWAARDCSYERARALAEGDEVACREALALFDRLGASPAADALRQRMRSEGIGRVPRGPRTATRSNSLGLTPRQAEILLLLKEGLTNAAIARRLHISAKTVDHHVSAILAKLGVSSRLEVAKFEASPEPMITGGIAKNGDIGRPR